MRAYIDAIATSIRVEVIGASAWTLRKHQPLWVTTVETPTLYIYGTRRVSGEWRTTGSREDIYEVVIEYHEPATDQEDFERSEAAEAALDELVDSLTEWTNNHQTISTGHRLDYVSAEYAPAIRRQLLVRAFQITLQVRDVALYG